MKRALTILFLIVILGLIVFWIWRVFVLLDENNALRMEIKRVESERDHIDTLYQEKLQEIERLKRKTETPRGKEGG